MENGTIVKYSRPESPEESELRFRVVEDRGNRVLIELICDWRIRPTQCVPTVEVVQP